jgi:hypothetical protein
VTVGVWQALRAATARRVRIFFIFFIVLFGDQGIAPDAGSRQLFLAALGLGAEGFQIGLQPFVLGALPGDLGVRVVARLHVLRVVLVGVPRDRDVLLGVRLSAGAGRETDDGEVFQ